MQKDYLDKLAFKALVASADKLGYDGEKDIADRLERGSYQSYIKPIVFVACTFALDVQILSNSSCYQVSHRFGLLRAAVRKAIKSVADHAFQLMLPTGPGIPDKKMLLSDMNYIYPWSQDVRLVLQFAVWILTLL